MMLEIYQNLAFDFFKWDGRRLFLICDTQAAQHEAHQKKTRDNGRRKSIFILVCATHPTSTRCVGGYLIECIFSQAKSLPMPLDGGFSVLFFPERFRTNSSIPRKDGRLAGLDGIQTRSLESGCTQQPASSPAALPRPYNIAICL